MDISKFEEMLARGEDNALLRFTLGSAFYQAGKFAEAELHLAKAIEFNPKYSAAWKIYGRALSESGKTPTAVTAFKQGIAVASEQGDMQTVREMNVFLNRLQASLP